MEKNEIKMTQEALEKAIAEFQNKKSKELLNKVKELEEKLAKLEKANDEKIEYPDYGKMSRDEVKGLAVEYFRALGRRNYMKIRALTGGSNLVPAPVRAEIYEVATQYGVIRKYATLIDMTSDTLKLPVASNDLELVDTDAGNIYAEGNIGINSVILEAGKATTYVDIEEEVLADANVSVLNYIFDVFGRAVAKYEDRKSFNDATVGILANGTAYVLGSGKTSYADVDFDDLANVIAQLDEGHDADARFFMHKSLVMALMQKKDSNSNYIMTPPGAEIPGTIWNYEYVRSAVLPSTSDSSQAGKAFMVFGNLKNFALGLREPLSLRVLTEVVATNGKVRVVAKERVGMGVLAPTDLIVIKTSAS